MTCYHPLNAWEREQPNKNGKKSIVFKQEHAGLNAQYLQLPCGQCIGCRLERSRQWALRCVHENTLHKESAFLTLTYNEQSLPPDGGLVKEHFVKFMKRYRTYLVREERGQKIRYFMCGEYGEKKLRPHYHAIIWGHDFPDKKHYTTTDRGDRLYRSDIATRLWTHGFVTIGSVTFESAAYVARYVLKKIRTRNSEKVLDYLGDRRTHEEVSAYSRCDPETGEAFMVTPEYTTMSRGHGIGQGWYDKYGEETYRDDYIIERGIRMQPPRYYDKQYHDIETIKINRKAKATKRNKENTPQRLRTREKVKRAQLRFLKRSTTEELA